MAESLIQMAEVFMRWVPLRICADTMPGGQMVVSDKTASSRVDKRSASTFLVWWMRYAYPPYIFSLYHKNHRILLCCLLSSVFCPLNAEELPDPTRPPAIIAAPAAAPGEVENKPLGLQSVIISKERRAAIIDGETVELGGKHGDARLVEVNEDNVVLQGAKGRQVVTLFPDVRMAARKKVEPQSSADNVQTSKRTNKLKQKNRRKQTTKPAPHKEEK